MSEYLGRWPYTDRTVLVYHHVDNPLRCQVCGGLIEDEIVLMDTRKRPWCREHAPKPDKSREMPEACKNGRTVPLHIRREKACFETMADVYHGQRRLEDFL